jgi:hypothetical protein
LVHLLREKIFACVPKGWATALMGDGEGNGSEWHAGQEAVLTGVRRP